MPILQKLFSHLLVAAFALSSVTCPCSAQASSEARSHAHHQSQQESSATIPDGCQHSECVTDCGRISADSSPRDATLLCKSKFQLDNSAAVEPESLVLTQRSQPVTWTGPPLRRFWLSHDTPVRRFDRLLD